MPPLTDRRAFLQASLFAASAIPALPLAGEAAGSVRTGKGIGPATGAHRIRKIGPVFVVDGWILTAADMDALGLARETAPGDVPGDVLGDARETAPRPHDL